MERTTGTIVEPFHGSVNVLLGLLREVRSFREEPPQFPVHEFIEATVTGSVGSGAVHGHVQVLGDFFMLRNLFAIVVRHC